MLLSIITISFNSANTLRSTLESIASQELKNFEYILIDGGSTDGTIELIREYENHIDYWISEADGGIADAMNKGWQVAKGEYVLFIHSDDQLISQDTTRKMAKSIDEYPDYSMICFDIWYGNNSSNVVKRSRGMGYWMNFKTGFWHQGTVVKNHLKSDIGFFDNNFSIATDYDWFLRAYRKRTTAKSISLPICLMSDQGVSAKRDCETLTNRLMQEKAIHFKNCPNRLMKMIYRLWWAFYPIYKTS